MIGVGGEDVVGDDQPEHGVAEELQSLVGQLTRVLGAPRPVREGPMPAGPGSANAQTESFDEQRAKVGSVIRTPRRPCDVVDGVAHRLQVLEVLVVDAEPDGALAELLLERLDQLDQGERVGVEVVGERVALVDGRRVDLEDVGQAVADEARTTSLRGSSGPCSTWVSAGTGTLLATASASVIGR